MSNAMHVRVGGNAWEDGAALLAAIRESERGAQTARRSLSFESWENFTVVLTTSRLDLLRHLHARPAASIDHLADALGQPCRQVHDDVAALEGAGLIERSPDRSLRVLVDTIRVEVRLDPRPALAGI